MKKMKNFICSHKGMSAMILVIFFVLLGSVFFVIFSKKSHNKGVDNSEASLQDWEERIADLEEEPASEFDELYKDPDSLKGNPYMISINKSKNCVVIYQKNKEGEYKQPVKYMICSVGYDTPIGTFKTSDKYKWKIVNGNVWAQYATRVTGNVLIHSMPYQSNDKSTLLPYYYNQLGSTLSAGCVRMSAADSCWIMENCPVGTEVTIYESDDEDDSNRPVAIKVPEDSGWDPTDPDADNPWHQTLLAFEGLEDTKMIERGLQFDYMEGVTIADTCGNDISSQVQIDTDMDVFKPGTYTATYHVEDAAGKRAEKKVTFIVSDTQAPKFCGLKESLSFTSSSSVTRENILKGVTILDNNTVLPLSDVQAQIPVIVEGNNVVTLVISDAYQNVATATVTVIVDSNPPVIAPSSSASKIIPLSQVVDREYALTRITATDNGAPVDNGQIDVSITPQLWGYNLLYKVRDKQGNTSTYQDTVTYVEYALEVATNVTVSNLDDKGQLIKNVTVKGNDGSILKDAAIDATVTPVAGNQYSVAYSYSYASPLGSKTATATGTVIYNKPQQTKTAPPAATTKPNESELPEETPAVTKEPRNSAIPGE